MGACQCRRYSAGLEELGVPGEYEWDGIAEEKVEKYYEFKESLFKDVAEAGTDIDNPEWLRRLPDERLNNLKEENRRSMHIMQQKGILRDGYHASFQNADDQCQQELNSILAESAVLAPEAPPNAVIQSAVRLYHQEMEQAANKDSKGKFEDVKRGFFKNSNSSSSSGDKTAHGFEIGAEVEAHSLQTQSLNGARGHVQAAKGDRVAVAFPSPIGEKALKPANLKLVPIGIKVHPDAKEIIYRKLYPELKREPGESLGLALEPDENGQCLHIKRILDDGYAKKYNDGQSNPEERFCVGDRIEGILDGSAPKGKQEIWNDVKKILEVIQGKATPIRLFCHHQVGPPLRFKIGQQVRANCGEQGWMTGCVVAAWDENGQRGKVPYVIRINGSGNIVCAPYDNDDCVRKGPARFKVGDDVVANYDQGYHQGKVVTVSEDVTKTGYTIQLRERTVTAPDDINCYVRPIARFKKGEAVFANVNKGYVPGTIEDVYHPEWVYKIRLEGGNDVFAPEDADTFVKRKK